MRFSIAATGGVGGRWLGAVTRLLERPGGGGRGFSDSLPHFVQMHSFEQILPH